MRAASACRSSAARRSSSAPTTRSRWASSASRRAPSGPRPAARPSRPTTATRWSTARRTGSTSSSPSRGARAPGAAWWWSTASASSSARRAPRWGARASATSSSTTPTSRASTPRSARARTAGRWPTSARPTAPASTAGRSPAARTPSRRATSSSSARRTPPSRRSSRRGRARLRRPQVRLPRRAVPVPAVGRAQRAQGPARRRPRQRARGRAGRGDEPVCGRRPGRQRLAAARRRARARASLGAGLRHRQGRDPRARRRRGDPPRGPVRVLQPRAARAPGLRRGHRRPRLDQRHLPQRGAARGAAAAAPRRPHPHRRLGVHVRGPLMLRVAEEFHKTDPGRQRRGNEDALLARSPLFAVADGMGGAQAGEVASRIAVETLGRGLPDGDGPAQQRLAERIREANERIHDVSRSEADRAGMGTTITAVYVDEDEAAIAHVGDSRAYLWRDGTLEQLTVDHTLVEEFLRQGKLTAEEARNHPQKSIITRAAGPERVLDVDGVTLPVRGGDVFLVCSDGLTSMIDEDEIVAILQGAGTLADAGPALIQAANDAGGRDNITVILFRIEDVDGAAAADHPTEQATATGHHAPRTADAPPAVATAEREAATRPPPRAPRPRAAPVAVPRRRHVPAWAKGGAVLVVLVVLVGVGLWAASTAVYFLGTDGRARVTVFRGLPYELPLGVHLYTTDYVSGVTAGEVGARRRTTLLDHTLRSRGDAYDLVRRLEQGQVAR